MKKIVTLLSLAGIAAIFAAGCGPKLAETHFGPKELEWKNYLQESYPEWEAPQTLPPIADVNKPGTPALEDEVIAQETIIVVPEAKGPAAVSAEFETYETQKGDSLWTIAKKFYKDGSKWRRIQEANRDVLPDPKKLKPGIKLRIPLP